MDQELLPSGLGRFHSRSDAFFATMMAHMTCVRIRFSLRSLFLITTSVAIASLLVVDELRTCESFDRDRRAVSDIWEPLRTSRAQIRKAMGRDPTLVIGDGEVLSIEAFRSSTLFRVHDVIVYFDDKGRGQLFYGESRFRRDNILLGCLLMSAFSLLWWRIAVRSKSVRP